MYRSGEFAKLMKDYEFDLFSMKKKHVDEFLNLVEAYYLSGEKDKHQKIVEFCLSHDINANKRSKAIQTAHWILLQSTRLKIKTVNYHTGEVLDEGENKLRYIYWVYFAYHWEWIRRRWSVVVNKGFR